MKRQRKKNLLQKNNIISTSIIISLREQIIITVDLKNVLVCLNGHMLL